MKTLVVLYTSLNGQDALSADLANRYVSRLEQSGAPLRVIKRDLAAEPVPHLTAATFAAFTTNPDARSPEQASAVALSDALIAELQAADEIVLALPMYNFGIPSVLKAYFDHIARSGQTFRYTESGPVGLLTAAHVRVFATRGGRYAGTDLDTQTTYVRNFFAFLGIADTEFVYAEGTAMGAATLADSVTAANTRIAELTTAA